MAKYYTIDLLTPPGSQLGSCVYQVFIENTKTLTTIYSDVACTTEIQQPAPVVDHNITFYVVDNSISYDIVIGGGNLCQNAWIYNIKDLPGTIWEMSDTLWQNNPAAWAAANPVGILPSSTSNVGQLYTGLDLVRAAMRLIQVSAVDTDLTAAELADGIQSLNRMLDQWGVEELMLYQVKREAFELITNQNPYTIGLGATWNTIRPIRIIDAYLTLNNGSIPVDYPMQVLNYDDYNAIRLKTLSTNFPSYIYYQPSFPVGEVYIYPLYAPNDPSTQGPALITLTSWTPLPLITDPTCYIELPPGYWEAIVFNLAIRIAEEYQFDIRPTTVALAQNALRIIKRMNQRTVTLQTDTALMNTSQMRYNIYSDGYGR
jgi:hypothetical protein